MRLTWTLSARLFTIVSKPLAGVLARSCRNAAAVWLLVQDRWRISVETLHGGHLGIHIEESKVKLAFRMTFGIVCLAFSLTALSADNAAAGRKTENVVLFMTDGLRWQEVFEGADEPLLTKENGGLKEKEVESFRKAYWRDTPEARREALLPFFWSVLARQGQVYGNPKKGSVAQVTNGMNFSYPGYNETLSRLFRSAHRQQRQGAKSQRYRVRVVAPQAGLSRPRGGVWLLGRISVHFQSRALRLLHQRRLRALGRRQEHAARGDAQSPESRDCRAAGRASRSTRSPITRPSTT